MDNPIANFVADDIFQKQWNYNKMAIAQRSLKQSIKRYQKELKHLNMDHRLSP